jgi:hypothetical protein
MSLPRSVGTEEVVALSGGEVKVRGLTVREMRHVQQIKDDETADIVCINYATGIPEPEVKEWLASALAGDLNEIIRVIMRISAVGKDAQFPGSAGHDAGAPRTP